jgi:hypothetical protein
LATDTVTPSIAGICDCLLGGNRHTEADREAADWVLDVAYPVRGLMLEERAFRTRAVEYMVQQCGIRQFLDIGAGMLTPPSVHDNAQAALQAAVSGEDPAAMREIRVVYVDNDARVLATVQAALAGRAQAICINGDLRAPKGILAQVAWFIDLTKPVGVLITGLLPFIADDSDPQGLIQRIMQSMPIGSFLAITHATDEGLSEQLQAGLISLCETVGVPLTFRTALQIEQFFDRLALVEPGVIHVGAWGRGGIAGRQPHRVPVLGALAGKDC